MAMTSVKVKFRRNKKKKTTAPKSKQIRKICKSVISGAIENKQISTFGQNFSVFPNMLTSELFNIIPLLSQGLTQGSRLANRVTVKSLVLNWSMCLTNIPTIELGDCGMYFDLYIFRHVKKQSYDVPLTTADLAQFLQYGASSNQYKGDTFNYAQNVNRDDFTLLHRQRKYLSAVYDRGGGAGLINASYLQNANPAYSGSFSLTKKCIKKLKYSDNTSFSPTNCAIYAITVATRADLVTASPGSLQGRVTYLSNMVYEDA